MLFQFAYPFKIEAFFLVPQVLNKSINDGFIASKNSYHKGEFTDLEIDKSPKGLYLENKEDEEGP